MTLNVKKWAYALLFSVVVIWILMLLKKPFDLNETQDDGLGDNAIQSIGIPEKALALPNASIAIDPKSTPHFRQVLFNYQNDPMKLKGETIQLLGFITQDEKGDLLISRRVIECCEDDAIVIGMRLDEKDLILNEWYYLEGVLVNERSEDGSTTDPNAYFYLKVNEIEAVDPPQNADIRS